jgi:hypothetical protein
MRNILSAMCLATVCGVVAVAAQGGAKPDPAQKADQTVTVTGCVAPGTGVDQFKLTNAMMAATATAQEKMSDKAKMTAGTTYLLTGGEKLSAHVGHKVEITGTLTRVTGPEKSADKPPAPDEKPPAKGTMPGDEVRGTIAVTALKMVSTTCP